MQISARFVNNCHYSVKQWHTLVKSYPYSSYIHPCYSLLEVWLAKLDFTKKQWENATSKDNTLLWILRRRGLLVIYDGNGRSGTMAIFGIGTAAVRWGARPFTASRFGADRTHYKWSPSSTFRKWHFSFFSTHSTISELEIERNDTIRCISANERIQEDRKLAFCPDFSLFWNCIWPQYSIASKEDFLRTRSTEELK